MHQGGPAGDRGRAHHAARRRQVRLPVLRRLRRSARRRRCGRQRAVDPAGRRDPAGRLPVAADLHRQRARSTGQVEPSDQTGTTITFWADAEIFSETTTYNRETLLRRLQEMAFLNKGLSITLRDERIELTEDNAVVRGRLLLPGRAGRLRAAPRRHPNTSSRQHHRLRGRDRRRCARPEDVGRGGDAVERLLLGVGLHVREHDQHARGRHPRGGLPERAHPRGQRLGPRQGAPEGEGAQPRGLRHPRGPDGDHLAEDRRPAVRGPDQDQARQLRGQGLRAAGRRRHAQGLAGPAPAGRQGRHHQGHPGRPRPDRGPPGARPDPPQGPAGVELAARQAGRLPEHRPS